MTFDSIHHEVCEIPLKYILRTFVFVGIIVYYGIYDTGPFGYWCWYDVILPIYYILWLLVFLIITSLGIYNIDKRMATEMFTFLLGVVIICFVGMIFTWLCIYICSWGLPGIGLCALILLKLLL